MRVKRTPKFWWYHLHPATTMVVTWWDLSESKPVTVHNHDESYNKAHEWVTVCPRYLPFALHSSSFEAANVIGTQ
ncbi:hypothetical protein EDC04DRAFT_2639235 [Pisolithus marmoratus]|nr:hypothetical protein EDC04DRAFT_2639235 [Pisolithus marmoratus]